jgi:hypothetical protein
LRINETYWIIKALVTKIIEEKSLQQQDILHKIDLLDRKFIVVCKVIFGIEIVISHIHNEDKTPWHLQMTPLTLWHIGKFHFHTKEPQPFNVHQEITQPIKNLDGNYKKTISLDQIPTIHVHWTKYLIQSNNMLN